MWTCPFHGPIQLYFIIRNTERSPNFGLSCIKIWNYNRSLNVCAFCLLDNICSTQVQSVPHIFFILFIPVSSSEINHFTVCRPRAHKSNILVCCHYNTGICIGVVPSGEWFSFSIGWLSCQSDCPNVEQ